MKHAETSWTHIQPFSQRSLCVQGKVHHENDGGSRQAAKSLFLLAPPWHPLPANRARAHLQNVF